MEKGLSLNLPSEGSLTQIKPQYFSLVGTILGCSLARGSEMSRAWMLNDTLVQHIHSSFAEGSVNSHSHHSVIDTDTCRVLLTL